MDPVADLRLVIDTPRSPFPLWMERLFLFIRVSFAIEIGLFLMIIPWWDNGRIFSENSLLLGYPALRSFLAQPFLRGVISGLGLVDVWLGISEAVHYKESLHG